MIAIVDYGMGNLRSVAKAFEFLGADVAVTSRPEDLAAAEKLVLPGVGAFCDGMKNLKSAGLEGPLRKEVLENKKPVLGICLGMQLFAIDSEEGGHHAGLGYLQAHVRRLRVEGTGLKVPHVGWNDVFPRSGAALFEKIPEKPSFYFVHSFAVECADGQDVAATCSYGGEFCAAVQRENIYGVQFHPEKSQKDGMCVLRNFIGCK
jgi:glutamine amidotransferase